MGGQLDLVRQPGADLDPLHRHDLRGLGEPEGGAALGHFLHHIIAADPQDRAIRQLLEEAEALQHLLHVITRRAPACGIAPHDDGRRTERPHKSLEGGNIRRRLAPPHAQRHPRHAHHDRRGAQQSAPGELLQGIQRGGRDIAGLALAKAAQNGAGGVETRHGALPGLRMEQLGAGGDRLAHGAGGQDAQV